MMIMIMIIIANSQNTHTQDDNDNLPMYLIIFIFSFFLLFMANLFFGSFVAKIKQKVHMMMNICCRKKTKIFIFCFTLIV